MSTPLQDQLRTALATRYHIERELGRGGMATVFLARDLKHQRLVALKLLDPDLGAVVGVERFLAEIRVTANLQHPHLLPLFDSGSADGLLYYVMPYVEGESLRARLARERQLPVDEAIRISVAIAEALGYAHAQGVIHRDLKPENILLQHGQPVVSDFGIALAVSNAAGKRLTQTGLSLGTPQYMSPEQATGDHQLDRRSDVYSLATVTYEMLAGEPPHHGGTVQSVIARVVTERPANVRRLRPAAPEHVAHALEIALEKVPADRWATAREFADALQGRLSRDHAARRPDVGERSAAPRWWRWATAASLVVAGVAAIGWWRAARADRGTLAFTLGLGPDVQLASPWDFPLALSPNGRLVAYVGRTGPETKQLFVKAIDEVRGRPIPGTEGAEHPVFSADGRSIGYVVKGQLRVMPSEGGTAVPVPSERAFAAGWPLPGFAWSRNGGFVLSPSGQSGLPLVLHVLPERGGRPRPLTRLAQGEAEQRWPVALENGDWILYTSFRNRFDLATARIGVASLRTGESGPLELPGLRALGMIDGHLVFAAGSQIRAVPVDLESRRVTGAAVTLVDRVKVVGGGVVSAVLSSSGTLAYLEGDNREQELLFVDETGARSVFRERHNYDMARASPDGRRVALLVDPGTGKDDDIWILDRKAGALAPLSIGEGAYDLEWSADARRVYFVRYTAVDIDSIFRQPPDGSAPPSLVTVVARLGGWAIHPSERLIVYTTTDSSARTTRLRRLDGDTTSSLLEGATSREYGFRFSPDGRWLCFVAQDAGRSRVFVRPFPAASPRVQVSVAGGYEPVWSRDGRRLYYRDGQNFVAADLDFAEGPAVVRRSTLFRDEFYSSGATATYDVTRDGWLVLIRHAVERDQVVAIVDWHRQVRARLDEAR